MSAAARSGATLPTSSFLRFATCGSVDDGKSTLLGRLLFDAGVLPDDQKDAVRDASRGRPCGPEGLDFSLFLDGLASEREQGITIDVAYRYFETSKRIFRIADSPGHEQYTRNMATAASAADAAVLIVDATKGALPQTKRHLAILGLFRVPRTLIVINKMDLVSYDEETFKQLRDTCLQAAMAAGVLGSEVIPVSAISGDNVTRKGPHLSWHEGPTLLAWLEQVEISEDDSEDFRMPVQWVNRANEAFRGYSGHVARGRLKPRDRLRVEPAGREVTVQRIVAFGGDRSSARKGDAVTLTFDEQFEAGRGALFASGKTQPLRADQFRVSIAWFSESPMYPGRSYLMRIGTALVPVTVTDLRYKLDLEGQRHIAAKVLEANEAAICNLAADEPIACDPYSFDRELGSFILVDRVSSDTVAAGVIEYPLRRSTNVGWHTFKIDRATRARIKGQQPAIVWFTGLSGAGKSTIADALERRLNADGRHTFVLDGDNVRHGLNKDLGFTEADRVENVRRMAEIARLMAEAGLIVLVAVISPFRRERDLARSIAADIDFLEVFVDTPLAVCESRDPKGLYAKARAGQLTNFTGIDSPYEAPEKANLRLSAAELPADALAAKVLDELLRRKIV
jgi:bifunctional enzyme CysN/CysC